MGMKSPNASLLLPVALGSLACGLTLFLLWTCARGFGIWDEGLYLQTSLRPHEAGAITSSYYFYTGFLFLLAGHDIALFRASGIVLAVASAILLATGTRAVARRVPGYPLSSSGVAEILAFFVIGAFVYYGAFAISTPSYNLLNAVLLTATTGALLHALGDAGSGPGTRAGAWLFLAGVLTGVDSLVKLPSAALMFLVVVTAAGWWPGIAAVPRIRMLAAYATGTAAWIGVHFALIESPVLFVEKVRLAREYESGLGIALTPLAAIRYLEDTAGIVWAAVARSWPAVAAMAVLAAFSVGAAASHRRFLVASCWVTTLAIAGVHLKANYHRGGYTGTDHVRHMMDFYVSWMLILTCGILALAAARRFLARETLSVRTEEIVLMATLAVVPFVGAIGTHNFFGYNLVLTLAPWFALLAYLVSRIETAGLPVRTPVLLAISVFAALQILTAYRTAQYDAYRGVFDQTHPTTLGDPPTTVLLDRETRDAITSIQRQAADCGLKKGDAILGFYQVPGLVYALGGRTLGVPYFIGYFHRDLPVKAHETVLRTLPYDVSHGAYLLTSLAPGEEVPDLKAIGRSFPDDYRLCGETTWPATRRTVRLWKPRSPGP